MLECLVKEKSKISLFQTSSGQQCMILMMIGIVSSISDNSLVCIDEPEISLHPKWQLEFISILQRTFSDYRGCHFCWQLTHLKLYLD
ncbi:ATP-binding protein [Serratia marcescens]|uniref:ATP-binding protein n=1 Tax=Serratia marcescens TaxID=615 RepID=A0A939SRD3_SERMA|nr:ATP-binding protein [Serratia marcescens]